MTLGTIEKHHLHVKAILSNATSQSSNVNSISNSDNNNQFFQTINASSLTINEDDAIHHIINDDYAQEWCKKDFHSPEFQHDINPDDEKEVPTCTNHTINDDEDTVSTVDPPID